MVKSKATKSKAGSVKRARGKFTSAKVREIVAGAIRSDMRRSGIDPKLKSSESAILWLDDMCRRLESDGTYYRNWYETASDRQVKLFKAAWSGFNFTP